MAPIDKARQDGPCCTGPNLCFLDGQSELGWSQLAIKTQTLTQLASLLSTIFHSTSTRGRWRAADGHVRCVAHSLCGAPSALSTCVCNWAETF